nr:MAG TPA: hypothetical protein [Caudoviricetes sp.]
MATRRSDFVRSLYSSRSSVYSRISIRVSNIAVRGYPPRKQEFLGRERELRDGTADQIVRFVVVERTQNQQNSRLDCRRNVLLVVADDGRNRCSQSAVLRFGNQHRVVVVLQEHIIGFGNDGSRNGEPLDARRRDGQADDGSVGGDRYVEPYPLLPNGPSCHILRHGNGHVEFRSDQSIVMGGTAYSQVLSSEFQRDRRLPHLDYRHTLRRFMHQLVNGVRTGVQQDAVRAGEAEQPDRKVLGQQFVQADHAERLDHTDLELREVAEQHRGLTCCGIGEVVVQDIRFTEQRRRRAVLRTLLPDVASRRILDLDERVERIAVEHEPPVPGIGRIHAFHEVDDIIQRNGRSGRLSIRRRSPLDDALGFALAIAACKVVVDTASERLGQQTREQRFEVECRVLQQLQRHGNDRRAVGIGFERFGTERWCGFGGLLVLGHDRSPRIGIVHRRHNQVAALTRGENGTRLEHPAVGFQRDLDTVDQRRRNDHAARQTRDARTLLEHRPVFGRNIRSAAQQVVAKSGAVLLGTTFVGLLAGSQPDILLLGLPALDIDVALLGFDGTIGLLVLRKQRIPPLLLLGGHLATVGRRAQLVDPCENSSAALFKGFQFTHKSRY